MRPELSLPARYAIAASPAIHILPYSATSLAARRQANLDLTSTFDLHLMGGDERDVMVHRATRHRAVSESIYVLRERHDVAPHFLHSAF